MIGPTCSAPPRHSSYCLIDNSARGHSSILPNGIEVVVTVQTGKFGASASGPAVARSECAGIARTNSVGCPLH